MADIKESGFEGVVKEFVPREAWGEREKSLILGSHLFDSYKTFWVFRVIKLEWLEWP